MRTALFASLALATLAIAAPAQAEEVTMKVSFEDLDLTTKSGKAELNARLLDAAEEACIASEDWVRSGAVAADCKSTLLRKARTEVAAILVDLP
jgi:UrcA family protein